MARDYGIKSECTYLLANKSDSCEDKVIESESGRKEADRYDVNFEVVSAKDGDNVNKVITDLATKLLNVHGELNVAADRPKLKIENEADRRNCGC